MPSEWLPAVWGEDEPVFEDADEVQSMLGIIMNRYNEILRQIAEGYCTPIFLTTPDGTFIAADWADGFRMAVGLRPTSWEKLFRSAKTAALCIPMMALCCDENGESLLDFDPDLEEEIISKAPEIIPECVVEIAEFWGRRPGNGSGRTPHRAAKVGRNDPCPCGSGKKFKKCCGGSA